MGWEVPVFAHIPLIHGPDGKKLSKRHGAVGLEEYQAMGYPAAGMRNYLARLGWSHGDDEVFTDAQAQEWFELEGIGRAPSRLDFKKLENVCGHHMGQIADDDLIAQISGYLEAAKLPALTGTQLAALHKALPVVKSGAKTFGQLLEKARFALICRPVEIDAKAMAALDPVSRGILKELTPQLQNASWVREELESVVARVAEAHGLGLGKIAAPLRAALAGRAATPSVFDMMELLGREEVLARLSDQAA
jgi:glutamyl-tRNA synthetase